MLLNNNYIFIFYSENNLHSDSKYTLLDVFLQNILFLGLPLTLISENFYRHRISPQT